MKVTCIANEVTWLETTPWRDLLGTFNVPGGVLPVTNGQKYEVYAVTVEAPHVTFYIVDDDDLRFPLPYPSVMFEVSDPSVDDFTISLDRDAEKVVLSFPEWARDRYFYSKLVDEDRDAVAAFERFRQILISR